eukprot:3125382-Pleurochrysis_carterae.AAC.1
MALAGGFYSVLCEPPPLRATGAPSRVVFPRRITLVSELTCRYSFRSTVVNISHRPLVLLLLLKA